MLVKEFMPLWPSSHTSCVIRRQRCQVLVKDANIVAVHQSSERATSLLSSDIKAASVWYGRTYHYDAQGFLTLGGRHPPCRAHDSQSSLQGMRLSVRLAL